MSVINTHNFGRFWSVSSTITHRFGVPELFPRLTIPEVCLSVRQQHLQFWPILTRSVDYYFLLCGPEAISIVVEPKLRLRVRHKHSQFWPILVRFVDYYPLLWGPGVISTINEPRGAFTCRSSTLTILGSRSVFHD